MLIGFENNGQKKRFHYQFKKISNPSSNNPQIWSISDVARELFRLLLGISQIVTQRKSGSSAIQWPRGSQTTHLGLKLGRSMPH